MDTQEREGGCCWWHFLWQTDDQQAETRSVPKPLDADRVQAHFSLVTEFL